MKQYYQKNKEKRKNYERIWREAHPDYHKRMPGRRSKEERRQIDEQLKKALGNFYNYWESL